MCRALRSHVGLLWPGLGLVGSLTATVAATGLLDRRPVSWWWTVRLGTHGIQWHVFWAGIVLLCLAWVGLGRRLAARPGARPAEVVWVGLVWSIPLALGPALFSQDLYSYLVQGAVLAHGLNPYQTAPQVLHDPTLLAGVSSTWRHTTTPYGPVFIFLASLVARVAGTDVSLAVTLLRLPELVGLGLLAWSVPRLARALGADPVRATWLAVISPLSLLYLVGGGHNDALMAGLMLTGVALAVERRPLAGIALCALAATIKLPAAAGAVMIAICWWRAEPGRWRQILVGGGVTGAAVGLAAGLLAGVGLSWISGSLFSTPAAARMALTPSTAVTVTLWEITHHFGAGVEQAAAGWENAATLASFGVVGLAALALCARVRYDTLARYLGLVLLGAALGGPAAWPWYLSWGMVLLATDPRSQSSLWLPVTLVAAVVPVMASGQVIIPLPDSWWMVLVYAGALGIAGLSRRTGRPRRRTSSPARSRRAPAPALQRAEPAPAPAVTVAVTRSQLSVPSIGHVPGKPSSVVTTDSLG